MQKSSAYRFLLFPALSLLILPGVAQQQPANTATHATAPARPTSQVQSQNLEAVQNLVDQGHLTEALKSLDALAQHQPEPAGVERWRGKALYLMGKLQEADAAFQKAISQDSNDKEALQLRGVTLLKLGKPAAAIPLLEQSHENLKKMNLDGNYVLALCYLHVHRYDDARRAFAGLYRLQPDSAPAYLLLAKMLMRWNNSPAAQEMAQKALSLSPRLPEAHMLLGQVALGEAKMDDALAEFEREAAINPMYGPVYDRLGDVYMQKNQLEKAQDALNQALLLEPDATGPYILLGQTLMKQDNPSTAVTYLERAVQMDPGNEYSHFFLGQAYRTLGKKQNAMLELQTAQKIKAAKK
jgi:tetratricopeptide (TPR) repeat protein